MTLFEEVSQGILQAMKAREKEKLEALRNLKKAMLEARATKGAGAELPDEESLKIIQKLVKQGKDSAAIYQSQNRADLADAEMVQVRVLETFLPQPLSDEELTDAIREIISRAGATSLKDMGRVIGMASKQLAGRAEGKEIADRVKSLLS